jgi:hypothetical protein
MRRSPYILAALVSTLLVACGSSGDDDGGGGAADAAPGTPDAMLSADCLEAANHSDLAWLQEKVFTPSCAAFSSCHKGSAPSAGGLNLEDGMTQTNLVGVPSKLDSNLNLVEAGDPMASYLMVILGQYDGNLSPSVGTMPFNNPLLCKPKRDAIDRWIQSL